ncbi:MAG: AbrB family transcriptional regulator [Pseudolabrys sp.]
MALTVTPTIGRLAETLVIAAVGGSTLGLLGFPAGWISGAIVAVAIAALAGRPMQVPVRLAQVIFVLIGVSLGALVTPETLHGIATYPLSIALMVLATALISYGGAAYLRAVHGWDRVTAVLGSAPGAMSQVVATAVELNADVRRIVIVQTLRVVIVAVGLPALLVALGLSGRAAASLGGAFDPSQLDELAILLAASTVGGILAHAVRFPGGLLFGAMMTSAALHGGGWIHAVVPWWVANTVMIALGAIVGSRFANTPVRTLLRFTGAAFGTFLVTLAVMAAFAGGLVAMLPVKAADVLIAFAPGSVDAMMVLALALQIDPVYVGAHHLVRIVFVSLIMPLTARQAAARARRDAASGDSKS